MRLVNGIAVLALLAAVALWLGPDAADAAVHNLQVKLVRCNPSHLPFTVITGGPGGPDGGTSQYSAVKCQNLVKSDAGIGGVVYFGGGTAFTATNYTAGQEHCSDCLAGPSFTADVTARAQLKCVTNGASDAGVDISCLFGW